MPETPGLLRHRIDALSVATVALALTVQFTAFALSGPWWLLFPIILLLRQVNLVEHNHAHLGVFRSRRLNEAFGALMFLSNGVPLTFYQLHHVRNHHRNNQRWEGVAEKDKDWSSLYAFKGASYPERPAGKLYYIATFPLLTITACLDHIFRSPGSRLQRRYLREAGFVTAVMILLLVIDPVGFFCFFLLPWVVVLFGLGNNNYNHHVGCTIEDDHDASNVHLGFFFRLGGFNIGYHVCHHIKPNLHWSELPAMHASLAHKIPDERFRTPRRVALPDPSEAPPAQLPAGGQVR